MRLRLKSILDNVLSIYLKYLTYFYSILASTRGPLYHMHNIRHEIPNLCFMSMIQRSGSTLLIDLISSSHSIAFGGLLKLWDIHRNREEAGQELSKQDFFDGFKNIYDATMNGYPKGVPWGMKVSAFDIGIIERFFEVTELDLKAVKWIWLRRRNKVRQALSWLKMDKTGEWALTSDSPMLQPNMIEKKSIELDITESEISERTIRAMLFDGAWENFFRLNQIEPHTLFYEDFIDPSTWEVTVKDILDFLEVDYQLPLKPTTRYLKQSKDDELPTAYKTIINYANFDIPRKYLES